MWQKLPNRQISLTFVPRTRNVRGTIVLLYLIKYEKDHSIIYSNNFAVAQCL